MKFIPNAHIMTKNIIADISQRLTWLKQNEAIVTEAYQILEEIESNLPQGEVRDRLRKAINLLEEV